VNKFISLAFFLITTVSFFWLLDSQRDEDGVLRESPLLVNLGWTFVVAGFLLVAVAIWYKNRKTK
jgi:hypothetical protein